MRVRVGSGQLQVLRLLYTHRLLTAAQVHALAFETATRRTCEICLQRLHQQGLGGAGRASARRRRGRSQRLRLWPFGPGMPTCSRP